MPPPDDVAGHSPAASARDEDLLRLFRELPDLIVVIDGSGNLLWGNRTAERLFSTTVDDAAGLSALDYVHPEDLPFVLLSLDSVQEKEVGSPIEVRVKTPNGWRLMELVGTPVPWFATGSVLLCLRDLTE